MCFTIDVHHHILPDYFWRATNEADSPVGGIAPPPWSKEAALSYLDDAGTNVAITSISTPGVHMGDNDAARDLARRVNELSAKLIHERPDRFGGFAALPLPDVDVLTGQVLAQCKPQHRHQEFLVSCAPSKQRCPPISTFT